MSASLQSRQAESGRPATEEPETGPRQAVATALGSLRDPKDRMRYDASRRDDLPPTSCHVGSLVELFDRRVEGTEEPRSGAGAEALLQLRSDSLNETEPLSGFRERRQARATGRRSSRRAG